MTTNAERPSRLSLCPGVCDDDCAAACHEGHHAPWKREHHPDDCLGTAPPHLRGEWQALTPDESIIKIVKRSSP